MFRILGKIVTLSIAILFIGVGSYQYYQIKFLPHTFPEIKEGNYIGTILGLFSDDKGSPTPFYLTRKGENPQLQVSILHPGARQQLVNMRRENQAIESDLSYLPIKVGYTGGELIFAGRLAGEHRYIGIVRNMETGAHGTWELTALHGVGDTAGLDISVGGTAATATTGSPASAVKNEVASKTNQAADLTQLTGLLQLRAKLRGMELQAANLQEHISNTTAEIEKLSDYVADGEMLKTKAEQMLADKRTALLVATEELRKSTEKVKNIDLQFSTVWQTTEVGKLSYLSQQIDLREAEWINHMYAKQHPATPPQESPESLSKSASDRDWQEGGRDVQF